MQNYTLEMSPCKLLNTLCERHFSLLYQYFSRKSNIYRQMQMENHKLQAFQWSCLTVSNEYTFLTMPLEIKPQTNESQGPCPGSLNTEFICSHEVASSLSLSFFFQVQGFCFLFLKAILNYISPFPFFPLNPSIQPSLLSFKFMTSFLLIVIACIYVYTHRFLKPCSVCMASLVGMFSERTIWYWSTNCHTRLWRRPLLLLSAVIACGSCISFRPPEGTFKSRQRL